MHDGKIWIADWHNNRHEMTPEDLLERIRSDSASNWNWLAPATEIVRTISDPEFPEPIANELKGIVLKCFAEILLSDLDGNEKSTDQLAVAYCYYSVRGKAGKRIKRLYRKNLLERVIKYSYWIKPYGADGGEWRAFCTSWMKDALQHFTILFGTDFMRFEANAKAYYEKAVRYADKAGMFENDKNEYREHIEKVVNSLFGNSDWHKVLDSNLQ